MEAALHNFIVIGVLLIRIEESKFIMNRNYNHIIQKYPLNHLFLHLNKY